MPKVLAVGERLSLTGHVRNAPRRGRVALELSRGAGWRTVVSGPLGRHGGFALHWRIGGATKLGPLRLRLVLRQKSRLLAATAPAASAVGSSGAACNPPGGPGAVPAGDGWIVGGLYGEGGPAPGTRRCADVPYTITATDSAGTVVTRETVPADGSYTLVVPAGSYTLQSGGCRGTASVTAGEPTSADTVCLYP